MWCFDRMHPCFKQSHTTSGVRDSAQATGAKGPFVWDLWDFELEAASDLDSLVELGMVSIPWFHERSQLTQGDAVDVRVLLLPHWPEVQRIELDPERREL